MENLVIFIYFYIFHKPKIIENFSKFQVKNCSDRSKNFRSWLVVFNVPSTARSLTFRDSFSFIFKIEIKMLLIKLHLYMWNYFPRSFCSWHIKTAFQPQYMSLVINWYQNLLLFPRWSHDTIWAHINSASSTTTNDWQSRFPLHL